MGGYRGELGLHQGSSSCAPRLPDYVLGAIVEANQLNVLPARRIADEIRDLVKGVYGDGDDVCVTNTADAALRISCEVLMPPIRKGDAYLQRAGLSVHRFKQHRHVSLAAGITTHGKRPCFFAQRAEVGGIARGKHECVAARRQPAGKGCRKAGARANDQGLGHGATFRAWSLDSMAEDERQRSRADHNPRGHVRWQSGAAPLCLPAASSGLLRAVRSSPCRQAATCIAGLFLAQPAGVLSRNATMAECRKQALQQVAEFSLLG